LHRGNWTKGKKTKDKGLYLTHLLNEKERKKKEKERKQEADCALRQGKLSLGTNK
jgi:hypothetical protein